jgi:hypothetical protein
MRILLGLALLAGRGLGQVYGTWKMNALHSTFAGETHPKSVTLRIEKHPKGEALTLDRVEVDGRTTSSSTILYFDGVSRGLQDFGCSGSQSSRRLNSQTIQVHRVCVGAEWTWLLRQTGVQSKELIVEISEKRRDGSNFESRLVLKKQ